MPSARDRSYSYIVNNALDVIADCEDFEGVLNDCQRKMLVKLAECIPLNNFEPYMKTSPSLLAVSEYLSSSCTLTKLQILAYEKDYPKRGFKALVRVLHTNYVLTHLNLQNNDIGDEIAVALSEALEINNTLTHLDLSTDPDFWEQIGPRGGSALATAITRNSTLKCLLLGFNCIMDSGALAFADALETNSTLTQLNLFGNGIGDSGTEAICKALESNHVMTHLNLGDSIIGDSGIEALTGALQSPATQLSYLHLAGCQITSPGVEALAGALRTSRSMTYLNLASSLSSCSATALADALQSNRTLTHLDLGSNRISDTEILQLAQTLLEKNNTLAYLALRHNAIGAKGKAKLELVNQKGCVIDLELQN